MDGQPAQARAFVMAARLPAPGDVARPGTIPNLESGSDKPQASVAGSELVSSVKATAAVQPSKPNRISRRCSFSSFERVMSQLHITPPEHRSTRPCSKGCARHLPAS